MKYLYSTALFAMFIYCGVFFLASGLRTNGQVFLILAIAAWTVIAVNVSHSLVNRKWLYSFTRIVNIFVSLLFIWAIFRHLRMAMLAAAALQLLILYLSTRPLRIDAKTI